MRSAVEAGEAAVPDRRAAGADGAHPRVARGAWPRRAPAGGRRDGGVFVTTLAESRACLRRLKAGDRVALVAPASSFPPEEIEAGVAELARLGLEAVYDESIFDKETLRRRLRRDARRAIHEAWRDPAIAALIAMRGGYGSAQLLPLLDRADADVAQGADRLQRHHGAAGLYLQTWPDGHSRADDRSAAVEGAVGAIDEDFVPPRGDDRRAGGRDAAGIRLEALHDGTATGVLAGGTLDAVDGVDGHAMGVRSAGGCVLFLEDVGERPYRIHRLLTQAAQAGVFAQGTGDRVRRVSRVRRARRRSGDPGRAARLHGRFSRTGAVQLSVGSHQRADLDAAVRRAAPKSRRARRRSCEFSRRRSSSVAHSSDRRLRHRDGHAGRDAEASRPRRERIGRACLSADERLPRRRAHHGARRVSSPSTSAARSIWSWSATPSRAATRSSKRCWMRACAMRRCRRPFATSGCGTRTRS